MQGREGWVGFLGLICLSVVLGDEGMERKICGFADGKCVGPGAQMTIGQAIITPRARQAWLLNTVAIDHN